MGTVITPRIMEASHAVMRRTASMKSNAISGTREISTLSQTCPAGSRTCSNIALFLSHVQTRRSIARDAHTESVREQSRDSIPEFQCRKKLRKAIPQIAEHQKKNSPSGGKGIVREVPPGDPGFRRVWRWVWHAPPICGRLTLPSDPEM